MLSPADPLNFSTFSFIFPSLSKGFPPDRNLSDIFCSFSGPKRRKTLFPVSPRTSFLQGYFLNGHACCHRHHHQTKAGCILSEPAAAAGLIADAHLSARQASAFPSENRAPARPCTFPAHIPSDGTFIVNIAHFFSVCNLIHCNYIIIICYLSILRIFQPSVIVCMFRKPYCNFLTCLCIYSVCFSKILKSVQYIRQRRF